MEVVEALIAVMAVAWLGAATVLVQLWRHVRQMERDVAQQRLMLELRVMRARFRRHGPEVDPALLAQGDAEAADDAAALIAELRNDETDDDTPR